MEKVINAFLLPMRTGEGGEVPPALRGQEDVIFGNLEDISAFHQSIFLKELERYEIMPEDLGHCFVTWVSRTDGDLLILLYICMCINYK